MNNRQKAKHFKKLYESFLKKPAPIVREYVPLQHYACEYSIPIDTRMLDYNPELLQDHVTQCFINECKNIIKENIETKENPYTRRLEYELHMWLRK